MTRHEGTTQDIAKARKLSVKRIYQVSVEAGFPAPLYNIGNAKIYDMRQVKRFFANRRDRRRKVA